MDISYTAASESTTITRDSLSGSWILDKNRGNWSMRGYLETLNVPELAIQANEKGETELDTIHTIKFSPSCSSSSSSVIKSKEGDGTCDQKFKEVEQQQEKVTIIKRSRVNNDLVVELILGEEKVDYLKPDDRPKKTISDHRRCCRKNTFKNCFVVANRKRYNGERYRYQDVGARSDKIRRKRIIIGIIVVVIHDDTRINDIKSRNE